MSEVRFVDSSHRYLYNDQDLISVSKFTEKFKEKVDWNKIAQGVAKRDKLSVKEVLAKWERKRDISASVGTLFHSIKEQELIEMTNPVFYDTLCSKKVCSSDENYKYSIPISDLEDNTYYPELIIYDLDHMICGQADKVIITNGKINILDYKTDAEISFKGFSNKWKKARKLLGPLSALDDCNGNLYSIKMSLYMYMLWKANKGKFKPGELVIEHYNLKRDPDNDDIPVLEDGKPVVLSSNTINIPYRKKEVMAMLKTIKL